MRFTGQVALVTGASSGIGLAVAQLLASEGAQVGVLGHVADEVRRAAQDIAQAGGQALPLIADVAEAPAMASAVGRLVEHWGRLDIVMANAGINGVWAPVDELEVEEWDRTLAVNLRGTFLTFKYAVPHLRRRGGAMVITSSGQGTRSFSVAGSTAYACSKGAQVVFAKKMALELARDRIRVNVICPGSTATAINKTMAKRNLERIAPPIEYPKGKVMLGGKGRLDPMDVARLAAFLVSDEAAMITGSEVWIDGGMSLVVS